MLLLLLWRARMATEVMAASRLRRARWRRGPRGLLYSLVTEWCMLDSMLLPSSEGARTGSLLEKRDMDPGSCGLDLGYKWEWRRKAGWMLTLRSTSSVEDKEEGAAMEEQERRDIAEVCPVLAPVEIEVRQEEEWVGGCVL
jgi:hypothetical protein